VLLGEKSTPKIDHPAEWISTVLSDSERTSLGFKIHRSLAEVQGIGNDY
jgi:hypothetical protein